MPTIKQEKAFNKTIENCGNVSKSMKQVGYSEATAKNPKVLTESKGWKELCEEYLPDKKLTKIHKEGLNATIKKPHLIDRDDKGRPIYDYVNEDDFAVRHKYLDTAYKLKNKYPKQEVDITSGGEKIIPIYAGKSVSGHSSNSKDIQTNQED